MADETTETTEIQASGSDETRVIRVLVAVGGRSFSWQPGDEIELPAEQAAAWADGRRAVYVDTEDEDEDATNPPQPAPSEEPGGDKPTGDPGGEKHVNPPTGSTVEEPSTATPAAAEQVQEPSTSTEPQGEGDGHSDGNDTHGDGSEPQGDGDATEPASVDADGINATGGGWYEITAAGEVVDKVRGEEAAQARLDELRAAAE